MYLIRYVTSLYQAYTYVLTYIYMNHSIYLEEWKNKQF